MNTLVAVLLVCHVMVVYGNIWDNIVSNSFAPYLHSPSNFLLVLTDNSSFFKPELGISIGGDQNKVMLELNLTFGSGQDTMPIGKFVFDLNKV